MIANLAISLADTNTALAALRGSHGRALTELAQRVDALETDDYGEGE